MLCLTALLTACASGGLFGNNSVSDDSEDRRTLSIDTLSDAQGLGVYLEMMRQLVEGDTVTQAETFRAVASSAEAAPTTTNRLKLALALATPGHPSSDAAEAQGKLGDLLAAGAALLPEERMLVSIHLKEVEQRLILDSEAEQQRAQTATALAELDNENSRRLDAALAENARLRQQLEEAQQKLDAITNIERSIRERDNGSNSE